MKKFFVHIFLFTITSFICNCQTWDAINDFGGSARYNATAFTIGDTAYLGLGNNGDTVLTDFFKYDTSNDTWHEIDTFPGPAREGAVSFTLNGKGYVGLGTSSSPDYTLFNDFYMYDPNDGTWTKINDFAGPARRHAANFVIGDTAYILTGKGETDELKDFWAFDGTNWIQKADFTADKRKAAFSFSIGQKGYIGGGNNFSPSHYQLSDIQEYNPATGNWTERIFADGLNLSTNGASAFVSLGKAYICYGSKDQITTYDPITNDVTDLGDELSLGDSRYDPIAFMIGENAFFGLGLHGFSPIIYENDLYKYTPPANNIPTDISLSNATIDEELPIGSFVGLLSATDRDDADTHSYSLVSGNGTNDADNGKFEIVKDSLKVSEILDYESQTEYAIFINAEDNRGGEINKEFVISVNDVEENLPPVDIIISDSTVNENVDDNTTIAYFTTIDSNSMDNHTLSLVSGNGQNDADNDKFYLNWSNLKINESPDYEDQKSYSIYVRSTDNSGEYVEKAFIIYVIDLQNISTAFSNIQKINVFPNPSSQSILINNTFPKNTKYKIYNSMGQECMSGIMDNSNQRINIQSLNDGFYILKIINQDFIKASSFIKR